MTTEDIGLIHLVALRAPAERPQGTDSGIRRALGEVGSVTGAHRKRLRPPCKTVPDPDRWTTRIRYPTEPPGPALAVTTFTRGARTMPRAPTTDSLARWWPM
ncbi:hypothetical protein GCM10010341_89370 [Streptomyces noursei]|nr:hypothetical protein GCM10010341_89370 [Streptomyces noursei]